LECTIKDEGKGNYRASFHDGSEKVVSRDLVVSIGKFPVENGDKILYYGNS